LPVLRLKGKAKRASPPELQRRGEGTEKRGVIRSGKKKGGNIFLQQNIGGKKGGKKKKRIRPSFLEMKEKEKKREGKRKEFFKRKRGPRWMMPFHGRRRGRGKKIRGSTYTSRKKKGENGKRGFWPPCGKKRKAWASEFHAPSSPEKKRGGKKMSAAFPSPQKKEKREKKEEDVMPEEGGNCGLGSGRKKKGVVRILLGKKGKGTAPRN